MAEEWYRDDCKHANAEALTCADVKKSLGAVKQEQLELSKKLKLADQARSSVEAGLKTAERQAEEQCQKLHSTEIDLATQKQMIIDLRPNCKRLKRKFSWPKRQPRLRRKLLISSVWRKLK